LPNSGLNFFVVVAVDHDVGVVGVNAGRFSTTAAVGGSTFDVAN
jgi:hypothetical protein